MTNIGGMAAMSMLAKVGDRSVKPVIQWGNTALHVRIPMTGEEEAGLSKKPFAVVHSGRGKR